ncbi:hypothetical protein ACI3KS_14185 [Microbacterium sp. ZW T5_45]|uniref:hypothetical protein n=1 Tax=Microbacterium sp. ZW T5_45 TaxID=3378080 RepID=UPI003853C194
MTRSNSTNSPEEDPASGADPLLPEEEDAVEADDIGQVPAGAVRTRTERTATALGAYCDTSALPH